MRGIAAFLLILLVYRHRQFFDESVPCLRLGAECPDNGSPFKDDELNPTSPYDDPEYYRYTDDLLPETMGEDNDRA